MVLMRRTHLKVPRVSALFWIVKVLTTALGEAASDYMIHKVGLHNKPALAVIVFVTGIILLIALAWQISLRRYVTGVYWFAVTMVAIFGTMTADGVHVEFGVPYIASSILFGVVLAILFYAWRTRQGTLSIHSIYTREREFFYWAVVMATFALGTAVGDLTAYTLHLGFLTSGLMFTALIAVPAVGYRWFGWNSVFAFWFAYVLTRPLGASYADWLAFPAKVGGLGIGHGEVAAALAVLIAILVVVMALSGSDQPEGRRSSAGPVPPVGERTTTS
jgi:uncharacterized membrane-anchored protein